MRWSCLASPNVTWTACRAMEGRMQVRDTLQQLRNMYEFLQTRRERFGPNFAHGYFGFVPFAVGEPELVREILLDRGSNFSSRMGWDFSIGKLFEGGLMLRDFDDHRAQRNIMQSAFRPAAMRGYLDIINPIIDEALTKQSAELTFRFYPAAKQLGLRVAAELLLGSFAQRSPGPQDRPRFHQRGSRDRSGRTTTGSSKSLLARNARTRVLETLLHVADRGTSSEPADGLVLAALPRYRRERGSPHR